MHPKNHRVATTLLISLVLLMMVASTFYFSRLQAVALAGSAALSQTLPEKPGEVVGEAILSATKNDVTVEMTSAKAIHTGVEIGICYTTLDNGEWYPLPGHLFYGNYEIYPDEIEFLEGEILADGKNTGRRCALIRYRIDDLNTLTAPVGFSVLQFYAPGREMYTPCEELRQRLNTSPKAQAYSLVAECAQAGDGSTSLTLINYDPAVPETEVRKTLDYIARAEVDGPWEFTVDQLER